jgi:hypothetical protein
MFKKKYRVRVNYKSGRSETFRVVDFKYSVVNGDVRVSWDMGGRSNRARPHFMGVDNIESVWVLN